MSNTLNPIAPGQLPVGQQLGALAANAPASPAPSFSDDEVLLSPRKQRAAVAHGLEGGGHAAKTIIGAFLLAGGLALRAAPGWLRGAVGVFGGIQALSGGISLIAWTQKPESR
ncbi:MAG: hypothetical protein VKS61_03850 [Candidatus Sericytochromatia bacterium]|nr:hypothetical protein [Candidatus Sericytochromatia bacterium]